MLTLSLYLMVAALSVSIIGIPLFLYIDRNKEQAHDNVMILIIVSTLLLVSSVVIMICYEYPI